MFPRLPQLARAVRSRRPFGAVLGAGISVSAGLPAFRSSNAVFRAMEREYADFPGRGSGPDAFLMYAFSVRALRNDPRLQYRVIAAFDRATAQTHVQPTLGHVFLRWLAERQQLRCVVTQNIDDLEEAAGLATLGDRLVQAHGTFAGSMVCVNQRCPARLAAQDLLRMRRWTEVLGEKVCTGLARNVAPNRAPLTQPYVFAGFKHVLQIDHSMPRYSQRVFQMALLDQAVPCCAVCGAALKPSMVLYEEATAIDDEQLFHCFDDIEELLVIGTSLNVAPVNYLPALAPARTTVHIIARDIDFEKYLGEVINSRYSVFNRLIDIKMMIARYKDGD